MSRAWGIRDCFGDTEGVGVLSEVGIRGVNWRVCGDACMVAALGRLRFFRHGRDALNSMAKGKRSVASCRLGLCGSGRFWQVILGAVRIGGLSEEVKRIRSHRSRKVEGCNNQVRFMTADALTMWTS